MLDDKRHVSESQGNYDGNKLCNKPDLLLKHEKILNAVARIATQAYDQSF